MEEAIVDIETSDGKMETFITHPDEGGPFPVIVMYMDAPGIREELYDFARRVGTVGYYCMLPDLYYRAGRIRYDRASMTQTEREQMGARWRAMTNAMVLDDTRGMLRYLESDGKARGGPKGNVGYCMSGQWVLSAAGTVPEEFRATVAVHGVKHITDEPDSPHLLADRFQGEVYCAYAEHDSHIPSGEVEALEKAFGTSPARCRVEVFGGTDHGYVFPERDGIFVKHAAETTWERSFGMYKRQVMDG